MSSDVWYVRDRNRVTGPFDREQLEALRQRGQLARFHQVSADGQHWVSATTVDGLFASTTPTVAIELDPPEYAVASGTPELWYYSSGKDPVGPVRVDELLGLVRNGVLHVDTLVWREGLPNWIALRDSGLVAGVETFAPGAAPAAVCRPVPGHGKNKISAALLAFFLGWLGIHKFYLGAWGWGLIYLIFFWTLIPALLAFIEFIVFLVMSDDSFDARYNAGPVTAFTW